MTATAVNYHYPGNGEVAAVMVIATVSFLTCLFCARWIAKALERPGSWGRFKARCRRLLARIPLGVLR